MRSRLLENHGRLPLLCLLSLDLQLVRAASLKRPASTEFHISFDEPNLPCDFAEGEVIQDQYWDKMVRFQGPGYGGLNGGVEVGRCTLSKGDLPPLSNESAAGLGFLGFSTLHMLSGGRTGKPVSPEVFRFDVRMTNIRIGLAGLDGNAIDIELCAPPSVPFCQPVHA